MIRKCIAQPRGAFFAIPMMVLFAMSLVLMVPPAEAQRQPAFGTPEDVAFAKALWDAMVKASLVGAGLNSRPYEGTEPHGAVLTTDRARITVNGVTGWVIVKKNFGPPGISVEKVEAEGEKHLKAVTVMFKRPGYDPDNKDWFWVKYRPDGSLDRNPAQRLLAGRIAKGANKGCIACHRNAEGEDYVFSPYMQM